MDTFGLIQPYRLNGPLTEEERALWLDQRLRLNVTPQYELSVIRMNSTFLEVVDRWFSFRGTLFLLLGAMGLGALAAYLSLMTMVLFAPADAAEGPVGNAIWIGIVSLMFLPFIAVMAWGARKESFRLTHYPIRLNRANRMLYVFRLDGTILTVPWDRVFFTLGRGTSMFGQTWDIRALVVAEDDVTVRDTFSFSLCSDDQDHVRQHWEFLRRYMEEGPRELVRGVEFCMPVDGKRESLRVAMERIFAPYANYPFVYWMLWPINFLIACSRWLAARTSRLPVWPAEIEAACRVDPGDVHVRDAKNNPVGLR